MSLLNFRPTIEQGIKSCNGGVKACGLNALRHIDKGRALIGVDEHMAIFRAITAEEEAASALFYVLKNNRYKNAGVLEEKNHVYKLGLFPFLKIVGHFITEGLGTDSHPIKSYRLVAAKVQDRHALKLVLSLTGVNLEAAPSPPLSMIVKDHSTMEFRDFSEQFEGYYTSLGHRSALHFLKEIANLRNQLLYADPGGLPAVRGDLTQYLSDQEHKVLALLAIVLLVDPWEKEQGKSNFVQQVLDSFLVQLKKISREVAFDF
jgi:hypothetical protein